MQTFLRSTEIIDWLHPDVSACALRLRGDSNDPLVIARRCFEWVRDEIKHTADYGLKPVTCAASEVLQEGSGYCYAKSHLLAAVLRANGIPAGLCYQRLSLDGHGRPSACTVSTPYTCRVLGGIESIRAVTSPGLMLNLSRRQSKSPSESALPARPTSRKSGRILIRSSLLLCERTRTPICSLAHYRI
jgi:hypothetical protein